MLYISDMAIFIPCFLTHCWCMMSEKKGFNNEDVMIHFPQYKFEQITSLVI